LLDIPNDHVAVDFILRSIPSLHRSKANLPQENRTVLHLRLPGGRLVRRSMEARPLFLFWTRSCILTRGDDAYCSSASKFDKILALFWEIVVVNKATDAGFHGAVFA